MSCVCGHEHGADGCPCGCTLFTPDDGHAHIGDLLDFWPGAFKHIPSDVPNPFDKNVG